MCQQCVDAVRKHWPDLPEDQYGELLWGATAFPFACGEETANQVAEMAERSGQDLGLALADEDTDRAMKALDAQPDKV